MVLSERLERVKTSIDTDRGCFFITDINDIAWLTGFDGSTAYVVLSKDRFQFITDGRYKTYASDILGSEWELTIVKSYNSFFEEIAQNNNKMVLQRTAPVYLWDIFSKYSKVEVDDQDLLLSLRMLKDSQEIKQIRSEYELMAGAFLNSLRSWSYEKKEVEWAATLEYNMRILGAAGPSFDTIVASGERSALPHGSASDKIIKPDDPVTIDFGSKRLYTSDCTRVVYNGNDNEILKVINIVHGAVEVALENIKVGMLCSDLDKVSRNYIDKIGYGDYFIHSLGHGVGIDVHELPTISSASKFRIEEGMVFTIEPGIYLPGRFGIRLEETVLISKTGCILLSGMLDKYVYKL